MTGKLGVSFLSPFLIHFYPAPLRKLPGIDEFKAEFGIVRKVVSSIVGSSVVLAVGDSIQISSPLYFRNLARSFTALTAWSYYAGNSLTRSRTNVSSFPSS